MADVFCNAHSPSVYYNLEKLLEDMAPKPGDAERWVRRWHEKDKRYWELRWKRFKLRHPSEPFILRCAVCSGREMRMDRKHGKWKDSKRGERKELKALLNEDA